MEKHSGSCLCSAVKFEIEGSFENFFLCHCKYCQKDTGSAHAANLFSYSAKLIWFSGTEHVQTHTLIGTRHTKAFCKACGSALPSQQMAGQLLVVPAGSLDTPLNFKPDAHLFFSSRAAWDNTLEQIQHFDQLPNVPIVRT